jgi:hypothetical protein
LAYRFDGPGYVRKVIVSSPTEFAVAVGEHPFAEVGFDPEMLARAEKAVADGGVLIVGEPHGVRETPERVLCARNRTRHTRRGVRVVARRDG